MRDVEFPCTRHLVGLALGYALDAPQSPELCFELAPQLARLGATPLAPEDRAGVSEQMREAHAWCAARFPLGICDAEGRSRPAIAQIYLARSLHEGEYLTASSPHRPNGIFVAAPWPIGGIYRLGSLLAHEAMHQALYHRERAGGVARAHSLAYSPWKQRLRPGRLVWHAFWTFSTQFGLLSEAILQENARMLKSDGKLLDFIAEMDVRIGYCAQSLEQFDILPKEEAGRMHEAFALVQRASQALFARMPDYAQWHAAWADTAAREIADWSNGDLLQPSAA
jgi:hypothetical protein